MKDKYYTPEIEEFHVGFEFEEKPKGCTEFEGWVKQMIHKGGSSIENHFNSSKLRVKYLDQEDIESLGFKCSNLDKTIFLKEMKEFQGRACESVGIMFKRVVNHTLIFYVPDGSAIPAGINLFVGTIKNKSELKKVLKMLNIN